jgi:hypothetical protein
MIVEITQDEQQQLLACIESAIKSSPNALQAATVLLPLANKIATAKDMIDGNPDG